MSEAKPREFIPNQIAKNESIDYIIDIIRKTYVKSTSVVGWYSHRFEGEVRGPFNRWIVPRKVHKDYEHNVADVADEVEYIAAAMNYAPNLVLEIEKLKAENESLRKQMSEKLWDYHNRCENTDNKLILSERENRKLTRQRDIMKKALISIKEYFCACSDDGEIVPQVVAHEALQEAEQVD